MTTVQQQEGAVGRMLRQEIWNKTRERQTLMSCSLSDGHKRSVVMERNQIKEKLFRVPFGDGVRMETFH